MPKVVWRGTKKSFLHNYTNSQLRWLGRMIHRIKLIQLLLKELLQLLYNQSRMCGKGVGLGLFPSEVEKWLFFGRFWANFGYVHHIPAIRF